MEVQHPKPGVFIAIEGPDGSGKGTQQQLLVSRLQSLQFPVRTVDFPQYQTSIFGKLVGEMLSGQYGKLENIHPRIASALYAADRFKAKDFILDEIEKGNTVIANRYTLSNMAHQSARLPEVDRADFIQFLHEMEYSPDGFNIPKPDLYIHLSIPVEITQELLLKKAERAYLEGAQKDLLEADYEHQVEAARMYHILSSEYPDIVTINCCPEGLLLPIETIHELVWEQALPTISPELREGLIETNGEIHNSFVGKERRG